MRILIVSTSYPVTADGSEAAGSFVKDFVQTLSDQGHEVAVVAPITSAPPYQIKVRIRYFWFLVPKLPLSLLSPKKIRDWLPIVSTLRKGKKAVDNAVKEFKPDHIFALWALPSGHWAKYANKRYGISYSIWALGSDIWSLGKTPIIKSYLKIVLKNAKNCFADGYQLAKDVEKISGKKCEFLPSTRQLPVCGLALRQSKAPYRLCFLGRWHPNKGIDLLLEALHLLDDKDWEKIEEVRIAGGGPMESLVNEQITILQEKGYPVSFMGFQDKLGAAELLTWTDYVMIPSRIESIPVIFSDAMQAMRPVIAMPVGDIPLLMDKYNCGVLVGGVSAQLLSEAIKKAINIQANYYDKDISLAKKAFELPSISQQFLQTVFR